MSEKAPARFHVAANHRGRERALRPWGLLGLLLETSLALRVVVAAAVDWYVRREGDLRLCLFPDTWNYWALARTIRLGAPYEVVWWGDIPHAALRTPGYPLFLAVCQMLFGERTLPVRLLQAALGTLSVYLVYRLMCTLTHSRPCGGCPDTDLVSRAPGGMTTGCWPPVALAGLAPPALAAVLATFHPYGMFMPALILSEAVFVPLMLLSLWGLAALWNGERLRPQRATLIAVCTGAAAGAAILVRPSWALFVPVVLAIWIGSRLRRRPDRFVTLQQATVCMLGLILVMAPWWVRNARIYGRFVPTALWLGASLYDGLNPRATGASDMTFLGDETIWPLDEQDQDAELARRAVDFCREHPKEALRLAAVKLGRYWSPWPHPGEMGLTALSAGWAVIELPLFGLLALGAWSRRRDLRTWCLLAGPLLYFCALHLVFASSMRYRIPGEMPALGLAALGWSTLRPGQEVGKPA
jgi:4-amino-4-deoxy-L-arabinose transferase-like glycosyltransferase